MDAQRKFSFMQYVKESPLFLQILSRESDFLVEIVNWMITRPVPSPDLLKKHVRILSFRKILIMIE